METIIQAADFHTPSRRMIRITQPTLPSTPISRTTPPSSHTRKGAFPCPSIHRCFANWVLAFRLLIDYRWFDAVCLRFCYLCVAAVSNPRVEKHHPKIRVWLRIELYNLLLFKSPDREASVLAIFPGRSYLGIWKDALYQRYRFLEGDLAPSSRIYSHF